MFGLSIFEILFLAVLALIVIGPKELPAVARTLGRFLNDLKRSTEGLTEDLKRQARIDRIDLHEAPKAPPAATPPAATPPDAMQTQTPNETAAESMPDQSLGQNPVQDPVNFESAKKTENK